MTSDLYRVLFQISEENRRYAGQLVSLAGIWWMAHGYFFEQKSADFMVELSEVEVLDDETKQSLGTIPDSSLYLALMLKGGDDRFKEGKHYSLGVHLPDADIQLLWELRSVLVERLKVDGDKAGSEFRLIGELIEAGEFVLHEMM